MHANDFDFDLKVRKLILETTEKNLANEPF